MNAKNNWSSFYLGIFVTTFLASTSFAKVEVLQQPTDEKLLTEFCLKTKQSLEAEGFQVGWLRVPENWYDQKNSRMIEVFFSTNFKTGKVPVLFLQGGPLGDSIGVHDFIKGHTEPRGLGMFYMDHRGTGCSTPLPHESSEEGIRRAHLYSSDMIVRDAEVLRNHFLQGKKWKIFGQSHGGTIANRYMMESPDSLLSVHISGSTLAENFERFYAYRLLAQYNQIRSLEIADPQTMKNLGTAKKSLTDSDCVEKAGVYKVCGPVIVDGLFLYLNGSAQATLANAIQPLLKEDGKINLEKAQELMDYAFEYFFSHQYMSSQAILRNDFSSIGNLMLLDQDCRLAAENLKKSEAGTNFMEMVINECRVLELSVKNASQLFESVFPKINPRSQIDFQRISENLRKRKHLRVFVYSGGLDSMTGAQQTAEYAKISPNIVHYHQPFWGHGGWGRDSRIYENIKNY